MYKELENKFVAFTIDVFNEASISIENGEFLHGSLPPKQLKMVQVWIDIHKEDLILDWELAVNGDSPFRIAPLQ
ncbi:MAG: DUF4160 domain-containing protein [Methylococcales bacterium]|nr:DUF4160 domain-containing protein [Methylococcales bacterium]